MEDEIELVSNSDGVEETADPVVDSLEGGQQKDRDSLLKEKAKVESLEKERAEVERLENSHADLLKEKAEVESLSHADLRAEVEAKVEKKEHSENRMGVVETTLGVGTVTVSLDSHGNTSEVESSEGTRSKMEQFEIEDVGETRTGSVVAVVCFAAIVCVGGVLSGYSHGFPSPTLLDLQRDYERGERVTAFSSSSIYAAIFGAIGPVGGLFGGALAGPVSDHIGRSASLVLMTIPHLIGWLAQAYAQWMPSFDGFATVLVIGRWFTGFATGWGSLVITVYMVEISPARLKGLFGSMYWFSTAVGILLVYGLGAIPGFTYSNLSLSTACLVLPCVVLYCFLPETPRWLATNQRPREAQKVLQLLRGKDTDVSVEMKELLANVRESGRQTWRSKLKYLSNRSAYKPLILSIFLMVFQQFTGSNVVEFYASTILSDARVVNANQVAGYAIGTTQVAAVLVSLLLVDYVGRKVLLVISSVLVCISTALLGLYYFLTDLVCVKYYHVNVTSSLLSSNDMSDLPLFCDPVSSKFFVLAIFSVILFVVGFSLGWSTIPWVMMSELSPLRVRGVLSGVAATVNWSSAAFVTGVFPLYQGVVQHYGSWWTLTAITALSIPFVLIFVPETKGRSLEQIEEGFKIKPKLSIKTPLLSKRDEHDYSLKTSLIRVQRVA